MSKLKFEFKFIGTFFGSKVTNYASVTKVLYNSNFNQKFKPILHLIF